MHGPSESYRSLLRLVLASHSPTASIPNHRHGLPLKLLLLQPRRPPRDVYGSVRRELLQTRDGRQLRSRKDPDGRYEDVCLHDDLAVVRAECDGVGVGIGIPSGVEVGVGTANVGSKTLRVHQVLPVCKRVLGRVNDQEEVEVYPGWDEEDKICTYRRGSHASAGGSRSSRVWDAASASTARP